MRYTSYRDRPHEERQNRFQMGCREGHVDIVSLIYGFSRHNFSTGRFLIFFFFLPYQAFATTGTNLQLMFTPNIPAMASYHQPTIGYCDFEKEQGMVRTKYYRHYYYFFFFYLNHIPKTRRIIFTVYPACDEQYIHRTLYNLIANIIITVLDRNCST